MRTEMSLYPWLDSTWSTVSRALQQKRIAHGLLLSGAVGLGKLDFTRQLCASMLCSQNSLGELACGECRDCSLMAAQHHPDYYEISPEVDEKTGKKSKFIKIDQIRQLIHYASLHSQYGRAKVILIHPAESMNSNAANALLKLLEEPPANTYFMLISHSATQLAATIKSRCQEIKFSYPHRTIAQHWLQQQGVAAAISGDVLSHAYGAPLIALELAESAYLNHYHSMVQNLVDIAFGQQDPLTISETWLKLGIDMPLKCMYHLISTMVRLKSNQQWPMESNSNYQQELRTLAKIADIIGLYVILDAIMASNRLIQSNMSPQSVLEDILNLWQRLTKAVIKQ